MHPALTHLASAFTLAVALTATGLEGSARAADGVAAPGYTASELVEATDIASGTYTASELADARNDVALAGIVEDPDPAAVTELGESQSQANAGLASVGEPTHTTDSSACPNGSNEHFMGHSWTHHSLLGSPMYTWHWDVWYCRNDTTDRITRWTHRADFITDAQWMVSWTDDQTTILESLPAEKAKAYRQRHLQLCYAAKFACANRYPWGRGTAYGLGYNPYFTGDDG
jgi:hypothetical protein